MISQFKYHTHNIIKLFGISNNHISGNLVCENKYPGHLFRIWQNLPKLEISKISHNLKLSLYQMEGTFSVMKSGWKNSFNVSVIVAISFWWLLKLYFQNFSARPCNESIKQHLPEYNIQNP